MRTSPGAPIDLRSVANQETFATRIAPAIPGLAGMSDLEGLSAIGRFCHQFCDLSLLNRHQVLTIGGGAADLASNMDKFNNNEGGVWCGGTAIMCAQMLNASGRVDKAWYYGDGIPILTHATTLAMVGGILYHFDPYFNGEYIDAQGQIMPYLDVLRAIKSRRPPQWRQYYAEKKIHALCLEDLQRWGVIAVNPRSIVETPATLGIIGRGVVTARVYCEQHERKDLIDQALIDLGYPAEPNDELWHYLRLHPTAVASVDYGDTDTSKADVLRSIQAVVSG